MIEGVRNYSKYLTSERLVDCLETIKNFYTKGIYGPITYGSKNHKALDFVMLYKADIEKGLLTPITGWMGPLN